MTGVVAECERYCWVYAAKSTQFLGAGNSEHSNSTTNSANERERLSAAQCSRGCEHLCGRHSLCGDQQTAGSEGSDLREVSR